jgi:molybdopterin/thiamine biosynthesis adenylyltransferase
METNHIRMLERHRRHLATIFDAGMPRESVAFMKMAEVRVGEDTYYLAQKVIEIADDEYLDRRPDFASINPDVLMKLAQEASAEGLAIAMVHVHPTTFGAVDFSTADDIGNFRTYRYFCIRAPGTAHVSLVFDQNTEVCDARVYRSADEWINPLSVRIVDGPSLIDLYPRRYGLMDETFGRQVALLGELGQAKLATMRIVIVGAGGIGSLASAFLVHSGARHVALIDDKALQKTNVPRVVGARPQHVVDGIKKVTIAHDYAKATAPDCEFEPIATNVEDAKTLSVLLRADLIILATDNVTSKALVNEVCLQYLIPILDLGVEFIVDPATNVIVNDIGKVNLVRPGTPCLLCSQDITPAILLAESLSPEERQQRAADGYVRGVTEPQPSMMAYNGEVVSVGVRRAINFLVGLPAIPSDQVEAVSFFGANRNEGWYRVMKRGVEGCPYCGVDGILAAGHARALSFHSRALT